MAKTKKKTPQRVYKKPLFIKNKKMTFPMDIIAKFNGGRLCAQCSACHGCQ